MFPSYWIMFDFQLLSKFLRYVQERIKKKDMVHLGQFFPNFLSVQELISKKILINDVGKNE